MSSIRRCPALLASLASALLICIVAPGCRCKRSPEAQQAAARATPTYKAFHAHQPVVAVARDARHFVTGAGAGLTTWSSEGQRLATRAALVSPGQPGAWVGISAEGRLLAEASDKLVRVVDVTADEILWTSELSGMLTRLWGPPVFSPDDRVLALPLQGRVTLVDARTGAVLRHIGHTDNWLKGPMGRVPVTPSDGITLARQLVFSDDGRRLAITCEVSAASPSNHTVFVADAASGQVLAELRGLAGGARIGGFVDGGGLLTADLHGALRRFGAGGLVEWELALPDEVAAQQLAVRGALQQVLIAAPAGRLLRWRAGAAALEEVAPASGRELGFVGFDAQAERAVALYADGELALLPWPGPDATAVPPAAQPGPVSPEHARARAAIWHIADLQPDRSRAALEPFAGDDGPPLLRAAYHYAGWLVAKQEPPLSQHLATVDKTATLDEGLLELAELFGYTAVLPHATHLLLAWLERPGAQQRAPTPQEQGRALGLHLASEYGSLDNERGQRALLEPMRRAWPRDLEVGMAYVETIRDQEPDQAEALAWTLARQRPRALEAWRLLVEILADYRPDKLSGAVAQARAALDPEQAETWAFLGQTYQRQGVRAQAVAAFRRACALAPDDQGLKRRLAQLEQEAPDGTRAGRAR